MINKKLLLFLINITNIFSVKHETIIYHKIYQNYIISNINTMIKRNNIAIQFVKSPSKKNNNNKQRRSIRNSTRKKNQKIPYIDTVSIIKSNRSDL